MAPDPKKGIALRAEAEKLLEEGSAGFLEKAKEAVDLLEGAGDDKEEATAMGVLATAYLQSDQLPLAESTLKMATELFKKVGDKVGETDMTYVSTIVKINRGAASVRDDVFKALSEVQDAYKAAGSKIGEVKVMCDIITYYLGRKEKDEASKLKAAVLAMGLPKKEAALAMRKLASAFFSMKESDEAHALIKDAAKLYKEAGDKEGEESAMKTEINMFLTKKEIGEALSVCDQMVGALSGVAKAAAMKYMSQIHLEQEDGFQEAIGDLNKARNLYKDAGDKTGEAEVLQSIAELYFQTGDSDEANKAAKESMAVCKLPGALGTIAQIQLFAGDITAAMETAAEMLTLATASGSKSGEAGAKLATANAVFSMDPASAEGVTNAKEALLLFSSLGDIYGMQSALHTLANAFFAKGDLEEGLKCAKEALAYFRQTGDTGNEELLKQTIEEARWSIAELRKQTPKKPMAVSSGSQSTGAEQSPLTESQVPTDLLELATAGRKYWGVPKQVAADPTVDAIERAPSHAIIWGTTMTDHIATQTCVEFGDLVGTMAKGDVAKIPIVITTHGVNARMTGEMVPPHITGVSGVTVWGMARTVRQEIPQVQILILDFSSAMTSAQIPRMLRPPFPMVNESAYYHRARWEPQIAAVPSLFRRELKRDNLTGGGGGVAHGDPKKAAKFMRRSFNWTGPSHKLDYCWYRQEWRAVGPAEGDIGPMPPPPPCRAVRSS